METARALAHEFHANNVQLVYGGGTKGLMGELARTLVTLSGPQAVHGVIPRALVKVEPGYDQSQNNTTNTTTQTKSKTHERVLNDPMSAASMAEESAYGTTTIVADMHTRKRLMATKVLEGGPGSGFVSLAGGLGQLRR